MAATRFALHCPKCGKRFFERPAATLNVNSSCTCASCGAKFALRELQSAARKRIGKQALDNARGSTKKP